MTRPNAWGPVGERITEFVPRGRWQTTTFVGTLCSTGLIAPMVIEGAINGDLFLAYVQQILLPHLSEGDIVVLDNLNSHKVAGVREAIEAVGAAIVYLPPYSPDFNPIEQVFSKVKNEMRKRQPRTREACEQLCGECCGWISPQESLNYIRHAGYGRKKEI
jgi:transposase